MKPVYTLICLPLLLTACARPELASICAVIGNPDAELKAVFHDTDGGQSVLSTDATTGTVTLTEGRHAASIMPQLWRLADITMNTLPETEAAPCGFETRSGVLVRFADGTEIYRQTSCSGNALALVAERIFEASTAEPTPIDEAPVPSAPTLRAACEALS